MRLSRVANSFPLFMSSFFCACFSREKPEGEGEGEEEEEGEGGEQEVKVRTELQVRALSPRVQVSSFLLFLSYRWTWTKTQSMRRRRRFPKGRMVSPESVLLRIKMIMNAVFLSTFFHLYCPLLISHFFLLWGFCHLLKFSCFSYSFWSVSSSS